MQELWLLVIFYITFGFWVGCGTAPAILVWIKNPHESTSWKLWAVTFSLAEGPIGLLSIKNWNME
ncbi:hypothetical protein AB4510_18005 [Vibrio sp. 10N.222.54.B12]|uniref:Uncharacterized protein n=1 Tax=Vibrio europaeus TaxID=300876 RepID=A0ABT5GQZ3_9VIBR|nr:MULTISPECIES: hypothetical protein [Vibrio]CAK2046739.1 conserved hypothetical protein [Vibrio crassostreae]MCC4789068.1 hypothetical protein [Vibrio splendidus]MDA0155448.1 hypothetical protein [Vibrio sp. Makdt]MDC5725599.1 hypothetical protein [Vibrio europaeus]MDC5728201.1 hypothetical protein [Vibrio europaeus]